MDKKKEKVTPSQDTATSLDEFCKSANAGEFHALIAISAELSDDGLGSRNIAEGDAELMSHVLARFMQVFTGENAAGGLEVAVKTLQQLVETKTGVEVDTDVMANRLVAFLKTLVDETVLENATLGDTKH